jgi:secondary thiamine-phosphate synthase enzyme
MKEFTISSTRNEAIVDITKQVKSIVKSPKLKEGLCLVYTPQATAAIIVNENRDPNVCQGFLASLSAIVPKSGCCKHQFLSKAPLGAS